MDSNPKSPKSNTDEKPPTLSPEEKVAVLVNILEHYFRPEEVHKMVLNFGLKGYEDAKFYNVLGLCKTFVTDIQHLDQLDKLVKKIREDRPNVAIKPEYDRIFNPTVTFNKNGLSLAPATPIQPVTHAPSRPVSTQSSQSVNGKSFEYWMIIFLIFVLLISLITLWIYLLTNNRY